MEPERGGDPKPLPEAVRSALIGHWVVALGIPRSDQAALDRRLHGTSFFPYCLTLRFKDGSESDGYRLLLGKAAWQAEAELRGFFRCCERVECDAIML